MIILRQREYSVKAAARNAVRKIKTVSKNTTNAVKRGFKSYVRFIKNHPKAVAIASGIGISAGAAAAIKRGIENGDIII